MKRIVEFDGVRMVVRDAGDGECAVLLHCSGASHNAWRSLIDAHQDEMRFVAPDLPGSGGSDPWPGRTRVTLAGLAKPVTALIKAERGPIHLVGHSFGGALALRIASEAPEHVRSLTLIEPSAFHVLRGGNADQKAALREIRSLARDVTRAAVVGAYSEGMGRFVDYWSGSGSWAAMDEAGRRRLAVRLPLVPLDFHALLDERMPASAYRRLRVPTLIVRGQCSPAPARATAAMIAGLLPEARLEEIPGAGHMLPFTHSGAVNACVMGQLRRHRAVREACFSTAA